MAKDFAEKLGIAVRIVLFIFSLSVGMIVLFAGARAALAATLKSDGIITGEYIRLGDVFDGVKNADYILGPAPAPGKDIILNARALYKISSALDVGWTPSSTGEQLVLRREASIIPVERITQTLHERLSKEGVNGKFSLYYTNTPSDIVLPGGTKEDLEITDINVDPRNDTFNAVIVSPSVSNPIKRLTVSGRIEKLIPVPVLANSLRNGDIIGAHDIDWIDLAQNKIPNGTILSESDIINMSPRRTISAGKPIISNELESPKMVDRGDPITLVFANGPLVLTTKGKSMQAGAIGDTVRVSNTDSNRNLQGVVTAYREVTIR